MTVLRQVDKLSAIRMKLDNLIGQESPTLQERCPQKLASWPTTPCQSTCAWWVKAPHYKNCSFLAAEVSDHTLAEIGDMMGVSRERIRQIENVAKEKLRKRLARRDIDAESAYQQGVAQWGCEDSSSDPTVVRENQTDFFFSFCFRDLGIEGW